MQSHLTQKPILFCTELFFLWSFFLLGVCMCLCMYAHVHSSACAGVVVCVKARTQDWSVCFNHSPTYWVKVTHWPLGEGCMSVLQLGHCLCWLGFVSWTQTESPRKKDPHLRRYLHQTGSVHLWCILLMVDVEGPSLLWVVLPLGRWSRWIQESKLKKPQGRS